MVVNRTLFPLWLGATAICVARVTYIMRRGHLMGKAMSKDATRELEPAQAEADCAGVHWSIEQSKQFALALGMSPEQVAALYDASAESPAEKGPPPQACSTSASSKPAGKPMSKYRVAFLVWWTTIVLFIASFMYVNWDLVGAETLFASLAVVIFAFGSWIPSAFLRLLRP
jgi:hypothetical protein